jgi:hypothetical protein
VQIDPLPYPHHHHQHHLPIGAKRSFTKSSDDIAEEDPVEQEDRAVLASSSPAAASADAKKQLQSPESCLNVPSGAQTKLWHPLCFYFSFLYSTKTLGV